MIDGESSKAELLQSSKCSSGNMTTVQISKDLTAKRLEAPAVAELQSDKTKIPFTW